MNALDIGAAIKARRILLGLTQERVATLAGVSRRTVSDLETGRGPRGSTLSKTLEVCRVLGLDLFVDNAEGDPHHV